MMNQIKAKTKRNANIESANGSMPVPTSTAHDNIQMNIGAIITTNRPQSHSVIDGGVAGCCASASASSSAGVELKGGIEE